MFPTLATFRFVSPTLGPRGTPPPPPPYWVMFHQWEQGFPCNELLFSSIFGPAGQIYRFFVVFSCLLSQESGKYFLVALSTRFCDFPRWDSSLGGGWRPCGPFPRWPPSLIVSHAGTRRDPPHPLHHTGIPHLQTGRWF